MTVWLEYLRFREMFREALDADLYPIEYLDGLIVMRHAEFRCTEHSAIVFTTKTYPSGAKDVHGLIAAGDATEIKCILIPQAEQWGRNNGCVGAIIDSRPGWAKIMKTSGYEPHQLAVRKEL